MNQDKSFVFIRETNSKSEIRDLAYPVICWCRKNLQLAHQKGGFVACFPFNVLMVHSPKLALITDGKHQTGISFTLGETTHFVILEFIANRLAA
jgi:hypothetical protein